MDLKKKNPWFAIPVGVAEVLKRWLEGFREWWTARSSPVVDPKGKPDSQDGPGRGRKFPSGLNLIETGDRVGKIVRDFLTRRSPPLKRRSLPEVLMTIHRDEDEQDAPPTQSVLFFDYGTSSSVIGLQTQAEGRFLLVFGKESREIKDSVFWYRNGKYMSSRLADNFWLQRAMSQDMAREKESWTPKSYLKRHIERLGRSSEPSKWMPETVRDVVGVTMGFLQHAKEEGNRVRVVPLGGGPVDSVEVKGISEIHVAVPNTFSADSIRVVVEGIRLGVAAAFELEEVPPASHHFEGIAVAWSKYDQLEAAGEGNALVIDCGAGTTDLSLLGVRPGDKERGVPTQVGVLGNVGAPIGGSDLDQMLVDIAFRASKEDFAKRNSTKLDHLQHAEEFKKGSLGRNADRRTNGEREPPDYLSRPIVQLDGEMSGGDYSDLLSFLQGNDQGDGHQEVRSLFGRRYQIWVNIIVGGLLRSIPNDELKKVKSLMIAGRSSQVNGLETALESALHRLGAENEEPLSMGNSDERKLAVVRGLFRLVDAPLATADQARAGLECAAVLFPGGHPAPDFPLVRAGEPLTHGRALMSFRALTTQEENRLRIMARYVSRNAIENVIQDLSNNPEYPLEDQLADGIRIWNENALLVLDDYPAGIWLGVDIDFGSSRLAVTNDTKRGAPFRRRFAGQDLKVHPVSGWRGGDPPKAIQDVLAE